MTALGSTVSPTLLQSAFYRECHSHKIPQIHCAMVHTVLLYSTVCSTCQIIEYFHLVESCCPNRPGWQNTNLDRRLTQNRWIYLPLRPIFYGGDLGSLPVLIPSWLFFVHPLTRFPLCYLWLKGNPGVLLCILYVPVKSMNDEDSWQYITYITPVSRLLVAYFIISTSSGLSCIGYTGGLLQGMKPSLLGMFLPFKISKKKWHTNYS